MNAITLLLGIDQNDPEQLIFFVKLVELMKWSLQQSELLRQPLTIQCALFDAYSHNLPFDMGQTYKESWIQIMMEADKSGQKKNKKQSVAKKSKFGVKKITSFMGKGNRLCGDTNKVVLTQEFFNGEDDGKVKRILNVCGVMGDKNTKNGLLLKIDTLCYLLLEDNNDNNTTPQQNFVDIWVDHTIMNTNNVRLPNMTFLLVKSSGIFNLRN